MTLMKRTGNLPTTAELAALRRELVKATEPEQLIVIEKTAQTWDDILHRAGLGKSKEQVRPYRETWLEARWRLGQILKTFQRSSGGRGKNEEHGAPSFKAEIKRLKIEVDTAKRAQRLGAMPEQVLRENFAWYAENQDLPTLDELIDRARKWWHKEKRTQRRSDIETKNKDGVNPKLNIPQRFSIIYADPPWKYELPAMGGTSRSIENHYPTMTVDEICEVPVPQIASDDATLYLWATAPKLAETLQVIAAWGFQYRTHAVWDKELLGMGYYFRNQHELLLVGRRGDMPPPEPGDNPSSVYRERRAEHSVKPPHYYDMLDQMYPDMMKVELFARNRPPREGWWFWGNEA